MNIFGVGASELILLLVIMLVVAGPQRMIRWAFIAGQYVGKARAMWSEVAAHLQKEFDDAGVGINVPTEVPTRNKLQQQWRSQLRDVAKPLTDPVKAVGDELKTVKAEAEGRTPAPKPADREPSDAQKAS